jgi:DNA gyrase/topoisomerase IV subunit A
MTKEAPARVTRLDAVHFVKGCYMEYGKETIEERAIGDDLAGQKPSHRRLVLAMNDGKMYPGTPFRKSAKAVADAMGNYHPHGDSGLYTALVGMVHDRYPWVEPHGNFGNPLYGTGTNAEVPPSADRYTEVRLSKLGKEMCEDLAVVPTMDNYDGTRQEPLYIPARLPMLLLNGISGIAVAVTVEIPPHNLGEMVDATIALIKHPELKTEHLLRYINGPDYPEGGVLLSSAKELAEVYRTGKGKLRYRCQYTFETTKAGGKALVVTSGCAGFNAQRFIDKCGDLKSKGIIADVTDESGRDHPLRLVVEVNNPQAVDDYIVPLLQFTVHYRFYALTCKRLKTKDGSSYVKHFHRHNLASLLASFIKQRRRIEKRLLLVERLRIELEKERCEARLICTERADEIIRIIRHKAKDREHGIGLLVKHIGFTQRQAEYVWTIQLGQIAHFSVPEQKQRITELNQRLKEIKYDLAHLDEVLIRRLKDMKARYDDARRTLLVGDAKQARLRMKQEERFVLVARDGGLRVFNTLPLKRGDYPKRKTAQPEDVFLTKTANNVIVITADGAAAQLNVGYLRDSNRGNGSKVAGVARDTDAAVVAIDEQDCVAMVTPPAGKAQFHTLRSQHPITMAAGVGADDRLVLLSRLGDVWWQRGAKLNPRRPNIKGKPLSKLSGIKQMLVVRPGETLYDQAGQLFTFKGVDPGETTRVKKVKRLVALAETNLILTEAGPKLLDRRATVRALRNDIARAVLPLRPEDVPESKEKKAD